MEKTTEEEVGREVKENNEKIVRCLLELRTQRDELLFLIQKQIDERKKLEMEMERLTYKLCLINKSMGQRMKAKQNYDVTIEEIEDKYKKLRQNSGDLMTMVAKDCDQLDSLINKKTSTEDVVETPKDEDAQTETAVSVMSEQVSQKISPTTSIQTSVQTSQEECVCLPNKDGRCIREKMASKMIQAAPPVEAEVPTKLEKELSEEKQIEEKESEEKSTQALIPSEIMSDNLVNDSFEFQKTRLSRAANQYKETSLRRSQS